MSSNEYDLTNLIFSELEVGSIHGYSDLGIIIQDGVTRTITLVELLSLIP